MIDYTVKAGDSLSKVAANYLGSPGRYIELAALNSIVNPNIIRVGQVIKIPVDNLATVPVTAQRIPVAPAGPGALDPLPGVFALDTIEGSAKRDYLVAGIAAAILLYAFNKRRT